MNGMLVEWLVAALLVFSGFVVLVAAIGLRRLPDFFSRMHAPALASTLAAWIVTLASILHFSAGADRPVLRTWLIIIILSITAPVTTVLLARAAIYRRRKAGDALPAPLSRRTDLQDVNAPAQGQPGSR